MKFDFLVESILETLIEEGVDAGFLRGLNQNVKIVSKAPETYINKKKDLRGLWKKLTYHLLNNNYKSPSAPKENPGLLERNFPNIKKPRLHITDAEFGKLFEQEMLTNPLSKDAYDNFMKDLDSVIWEISSRSHQQLEFLNKLRSVYMISH